MGGSQSGLSHAGGIELVVVALPAEDDQVQKYSSEKEPHLTLLYLGEPNYSPEELANVTEYIAHASSQLSYFMLEVERRGELGDQHADVLFFAKRYARQMAEFRGNLLQNELINRAYRSVEQYPQWTPHLTMGYPEKPAKKDDREYNRFSYVRFDRIALWTSDSSGPTFQLKSDYAELEVAMSQTERGAVTAKNVLKHYGKKGMKWGVRKSDSARDGAADGTVRVDVTSKGKLKPSGGRGFTPKEEAVKKVATQQVARKSGLHTLTNKELQDAVTRMNLEQQFVRLSPQSRKQKINKFVAETLLGIGKQQVSKVANDVATQQVAKAMSSRGK